MVHASCQKLGNCVYICWSYAEKTVTFFPGHGVLTTVAILSGGHVPQVEWHDATDNDVLITVGLSCYRVKKRPSDTLDAYELRLESLLR